MSQEGRLRIVTSPDTYCLGTAVGDFAITSVNDIHIVSLPEGALNRIAQAVFTEETIALNRATTATSTLRALTDLLVSSIIPSDNAVGIVISSGPLPGATLKLDAVVIKNGAINTDTVDAATSMTVPLLNVTNRIVLPTATINCPTGKTLVTLANTAKLVHITPIDGSDARLKVIELESTRVFPPSTLIPFNVKGKLLVDSDTEINTKLTVHANAIIDTTLAVGTSATVGSTLAVGTSVAVGTSLTTGTSATLGTSLTFASTSAAPIIVAAPFLSIDKLTQMPELRLGDTTGPVLTPTVWGGKGVITGTKASAPIYMEGEGFALVGPVRTTNPVAIRHVSGTAAIVFVDNGTLTRPAPFSSGTLTIYNSTGLVSGTISVDATGALSSTTRLTAPSIRVTGTTEATDATVITGIPTGLEVDRAVRAPEFIIKDGTNTVVENITPITGGGARFSTKINVPEVVVRTTSTGADTFVTNVNGGDLQIKMNSIVLLPTTPTATTQTVTLTPRDTGLAINPPAIHLAQTNGSLVTLRGLSDGTLATNAPRLVYQPSGTTVSSVGLNNSIFTMLGLQTIDFDTICSITASRPSAGRTETSIVADTVRIGTSNKFTLFPEPGGVLLGPGSNNNIRSTNVISLQAPTSIDFTARRPDTTWTTFKFTAGSKGELRVNDRDIGLTPYDAMSLSASNSATPDAYGWYTYYTTGGAIAFYARNNLNTRPSLLRVVPEDFVMTGFVDLQFSGVATTTYISSSGGSATFNGAWTDISFNTPISFKQIVTKLTTAGQVDKRPAVWRLLARTGAPRAGAAPTDWVEVARGGVQETTDSPSAELPVYDCYRFTVSVVTSGVEVRCSQLQLWGVESAPTVTPQNSFTGQHYVVPSAGLSMTDFVPGMVVVSGEGHDSVADGGFKGRGGVSSMRMDSALPRVKLSSKKRDPSVFGVVDSVKRNRWITDYYDMRLVVNGLGEGCILVTNTDGPINAGDLLCTSTVAGFACNQDDPYVASFTVAKATMSCDFYPKQVPKMEISRESDGTPSLDSEGLVIWRETGVSEPEYQAFDMDGGLRGALISCTYRCS